VVTKLLETNDNCKMNMNKIIIGALFCGLGASAFAAERPNFLLIMTDDMGVGQFAPMADQLAESDFDPKFSSFVQRLKKGDAYSGAEALEAARKAMPTMARLADDGLVFNRAFASSALCNPSRVGLASAMHPNRFGIYRNKDITDAPRALPPENILLPHLKKAGYATAHIGKWHLGKLDEELGDRIRKAHQEQNEKSERRMLDEAGYFGSVPADLHPLNNGFDYYYGYNFHQSVFYNAWNVWDGFEHAGKQTGYNTETFTQKAIDFIDTATEQGKPFFINLHVHAVHGPLFPNPPTKYMEPFTDAPELLKNFYGHLYAVDEGIRRIVEKLEADGQLDNTVIVFTSDNGASVSRDNTLPGNAPHRGQKGQYTLGGVRVPLVVYWPDRIKTGRKTDELASLLDLMPTAMDAAGVQIPDGLDGRSLLPLIDGAEQGPHDHLIWFGLHSRFWGFEAETVHNRRYLPLMTSKDPGAWLVVTDDWALRFTGEIEPHHYSDMPMGGPATFELYSMKDDPGERTNLATKKQKVVDQLRLHAVHYSLELPQPNYWEKAKWMELIYSVQP
jgi:uncharacterized sulfatase